MALPSRAKMKSVSDIVDPRQIPVEIGRGTLVGIVRSDTLLLARRNPGKVVAFLASLRTNPVRLVVPLVSGPNVIARSESLSEHIPPETSEALDSWPARWCEAAQCHLFCEGPRVASVADRSSNGTTILHAFDPFEFLPECSATPPFWYQPFGPRLRHIVGSSEDSPRTWSLLNEGDVLVGMHSPWVFAWLAAIDL